MFIVYRNKLRLTLDKAIEGFCRGAVVALGAAFYLQLLNGRTPHLLIKADQNARHSRRRINRGRPNFEFQLPRFDLRALHGSRYTHRDKPSCKGLLSPRKGKSSDSYRGETPSFSAASNIWFYR